MRKSIEATNVACNSITALVNDGSTLSSGRLNLYDIDSTIITRLPLSIPAFRDATDGTAVVNMIYDATAYRDATAALYDISNRDLTVIWDGTTSTFSGIGDFKLNSVILSQDSTVAVTYGFYAVPRQKLMDVYGNLSFIDNTYVSGFQGAIGYSGILEANDSIHYFPITGYVVDDSTRLPSDATFFQDAIIGRGDMTFNTVDWVYSYGHQNIDGTWVDGKFQHRWFDPSWIFYSTWYQDYDTSDWSLVGYKFREPVHLSTGQYYASMVIPETPGYYENRWTYLRDNSSYAKEVVQPFVSMSRGIDYMPDPIPDST